jgi:hypothetical protein
MRVYKSAAGGTLDYTQQGKQEQPITIRNGYHSVKKFYTNENKFRLTTQTCSIIKKQCKRFFNAINLIYEQICIEKSVCRKVDSGKLYLHGFIS